MTLLSDFESRLNAGHVMGDNVVFVRPLENVGVVYDILKKCKHSNFPVVDIEDRGALFGTIGRHELCILLQQRAFGRKDEYEDGKYDDGALWVEPEHQQFVPLVSWNELEKSYPKEVTVDDIYINGPDQECLIDIRPYANTAPVTIQETSTVNVSFCFVVHCSFCGNLVAYCLN